MPSPNEVVALLTASPVLKVLPWYTYPQPPGWHDPRDKYVERYWLPILGPSTTWVIRRLADGFDYSPEGFDMGLHEMAQSIGLTGTRSHHDPFNRALARLVQFGHARLEGGAGNGKRQLWVRRRLPALSASHIRQLPASLRELHEQEVGQ